MVSTAVQHRGQWQSTCTYVFLTGVLGCIMCGIDYFPESLLSREGYRIKVLFNRLIHTFVCTVPNAVCIIVCMKVRINITIDEKANNILNKQPNKSEYIEKLVLGGTASDDSNLKNYLSRQFERLENIIKDHSGGSASEIPSKENNWGCTCAHNPWGERLETQLGCPEHDPPQHTLEDAIDA